MIMRLSHKKTGIFKHFIYAWIIFIPHLLWADSKHSKNAETFMSYYVASADSCMRNFDLGQTKIYLDSAASFIKKVNNPLSSGFYYQVWGNFYYMKRNDAKAHENYYKAIDYYEKSEKNALLNPIYYNLAYSYYQKQDTHMMGKIVSKITLNTSKQENITDRLERFGIMALYFYCLYENDKNNTTCLDSVIFYENLFVTDFEANQNFQDQRGDVAFNYMMLALCMIKNKNYNMDSVVAYMEKAKQLSNPLDTTTIVNLYWIEGEIAFDKKEFKEAGKILQQLLALMEIWTGNDNLSIYFDIYGRLSEIAEIEKDYLSALHYEHKKTYWLNKIHDAEKYKTIHELSKKYETEKKDREIKQLQLTNRFIKKINRLNLGICLLGLLTSFFIIRWLLSRKKAIDSQLLLTQMERDEIELQARLKDEIIKKAALEKYESLLEIHFKNVKISEMDDTLMGLKNEQNKLNERIQDYSDRLQQYEQKKFVSAIEDPYFRNIANDVYNQIFKKLTNLDKKGSYLKALQSLNNKFFLNLKTAFQEDLSVINIKYCISFAIGMDTPDIAVCFCVELCSVHMAKHRLRSKLNKNKEIDFNLFLWQLNDYK